MTNFQVTELQDYLLNKPQAVLSFPFGGDVKVYKVNNKMFATLSLGEVVKTEAASAEKAYWWLNLKCDPEEAVMLRDIFPAIIPGYHMNKRLWNTVILDGSIPQGEVERMVDNSFMLVVNNMTKQDKQAILLHTTSTVMTNKSNH